MFKMKEKTINYIFFIFLLALGVFFVYSAFNTQMLGEDEVTYYYIGEEISQGKIPLFVENKPFSLPLFIPLLYSIFFTIFGPSLGLAKAIIAIFGILTILVTYMIGKKINIWLGLFSAILLLSFPHFPHFSLISYVEIPIAFFSALILYMFLTMDSYKKSIMTGIVMGLGYFTKISTLFLFFSLFVVSVVFYLTKKDKRYFKLGILAIIVASLISSAFVIRNIVAFNYPYGIYAIDLFIKPPEREGGVGQWTQDISPQISQKIPLLNYIFFFSPILFSLLMFGISYLAVNFKEMKPFDRKLLLSSSLIFLLFMVVFLFISATKGSDPRYLSIIFPQIALIGGYFLYKIKDYKKILVIIPAIVILLSIFSGITSAINTAETVRYQPNYVEALEWIKKNTPEDAIIFATYGGSVKYYAERDSVWITVKEFPEIMRSTNSTYMHEMLKKYNISYVFIWRALVAQDIVVPGSNILGVFTYNFLNQALSDPEHFKIAYQNADNIVFELA